MGHVDLSAANLVQADLKWARLDKADLSLATLTQADFSGASMLKVRGAGSIIASCPGCLRNSMRGAGPIAVDPCNGDHLDLDPGGY